MSLILSSDGTTPASSAHGLQLTVRINEDRRPTQRPHTPENRRRMGRVEVQASLETRNAKTLWVRLGNGNIIKRKIRRDLV